MIHHQRHGPPIFPPATWFIEECSLLPCCCRLGVLVNTADVSYVHADAHSALALKRPPGITLNTQKQSSTNKQHKTPDGAASEHIPLVRAPGIKTRHGLQKWLARQNSAKHTKDTHQPTPGKVGVATGAGASQHPVARALQSEPHEPEATRGHRQPENLQHAVWREGNDQPWSRADHNHHQHIYQPSPFRAPYNRHGDYYDDGGHWRSDPDEPVRDYRPHDDPGFYDRSEDSYGRDDHYNNAHGQPPNYPEPEPEDEGAIYDILLGADGGIFLSTDGGLSYDNGMLNIGISTKLVNHLTGTPLNRNMIMIGLQVRHTAYVIRHASVATRTCCHSRAGLWPWFPPSPRYCPL